MNVLFDTNIILSAVLPLRTNHSEAAKIVQLANEDKFSGHITASSVTDIYYIARKQLGDGPARAVIGNLLDVLPVIPVDGDDCKKALSLLIKDFEDALIIACAKRAKIDYVISDDYDLIADAKGKAPVITSVDFLVLLANGEKL
jgi:predicted nucleic acid-binding protein